MGVVYTRLRGSQRMTADSEQKRYVNVVGGRRFGPDIEIVAEELTRAGFADWLHIVPGPLIRATHGKRLGFSHMPLESGSTYSRMHEVMERAAAEVAERGTDPELDLQGFSEALWGHHSLRRFVDTVARQTMALTGASEMDIDLYFGWLERFYHQKMQIHYESRFTRTRRTAVTSLA